MHHLCIILGQYLNCLTSVKIWSGFCKKKISCLSKNKILHNDLYESVIKSSTTDALLNQTQYLFDSIHSCSSIFSLFLDFNNAFYSLYNDVLLSIFFCFKGLIYDLLKLYLTGPFQKVRMNLNYQI